MSDQTFNGLGNNSYRLGREIGSGGEGKVYEVTNNAAVVIKLYTNKLEVDKEPKLKYMASISNVKLQTYSAWPQDVVIDKAGSVVGFVMKKLVDAVPLHMLFSPMDRKKLFPDKGYNFLLHVAKNLAIAFHNLHSEGLVVGDVNENNILVDKRGIVTFIDSDSFQVKNGNIYHYCDVGVPRFTPPELLRLGSFERIVRTINTDSFSMAVLLFQLMFLGRHPFAGRNATQEDIDEEKAIKNNYFAYSLKSNSKKLLPPKDALSIATFPNSINTLFHHSFESIDLRPKPADWIKEIDAFIGEMITCSRSKLHFYSHRLKSCPWCDFKEKRNIVYFLDDSYTEKYVFTDIDSFINGFKVEKLVLNKRPPPTFNPNITPTPIDPKYFGFKRSRWISKAAIIVISVVLAIFNPYFIIAGITVFFIDNFTNWGKEIEKELDRRKIEDKTLKAKYELLLKEYNKPVQLVNYEKSNATIAKYINQFRELPEEYSARKKQIEENLYEKQLQLFLKDFYIKDYPIKNFGPRKRSLLFLSGILTVADITKITKLKIPGIAEANIQILLSWQRQFISKFVYTPDVIALNHEINVMTEEIKKKRSSLEGTIKREYHSSQVIKANILSSFKNLESQMDAAFEKHQQAEIDYKSFEEFLKQPVFKK